MSRADRIARRRATRSSAPAPPKCARCGVRMRITGSVAKRAWECPGCRRRLFQAVKKKPEDKESQNEAT